MMKVNESVDRQYAFLQKLRTESGPMHKKLEETELSSQLLSSQVDVTGYMNYLIAMREVISWYELCVLPLTQQVISDSTERSKLHLLDNDLIVMGYTAPVRNDYSCEGVSGSLAMALGYMYVIEGSTLGGQVILKHVRSVAGSGQAVSTAFFTGYGADTGKYWRSFIARLSDYAIYHNCEDEIIAGSILAFESIENYFANSACR